MSSPKSTSRLLPPFAKVFVPIALLAFTQGYWAKAKSDDRKGEGAFVDNAYLLVDWPGKNPLEEQIQGLRSYLTALDDYYPASSFWVSSNLKYRVWARLANVYATAKMQDERDDAVDKALAELYFSRPETIGRVTDLWELEAFMREEDRRNAAICYGPSRSTWFSDLWVSNWVSD